MEQARIKSFGTAASKAIMNGHSNKFKLYNVKQMVGSELEYSFRKINLVIYPPNL